MKPVVNVCGPTVRRWIFGAMTSAIEEQASLVDVVVSDRAEREADLVHFFRPQDAEAWLRSGGAREVRFVTTLHGYLPGATEYERNRRAYDQAARVISVYEGGRRYLKGKGVPEEKIEVIHAGADPEMFRPEVPDYCGHFVVGVSARMYERHGSVWQNKGGPLIAKVMHALRDEPFILMLVGTGWTDLVRFLTHVPVGVVYYERGRNCEYGDYPKLYNRMNCLLVASRYEGGPVSLYEAMMCGKPVVAMPVGVVPEFVEPGASGYIFEHGDAAGCTACLRRMRRERELWSSRAPAIRQRVARFSWERFGKEHERLYLNALSQDTGPPALRGLPESQRCAIA